jgi:hypothetical protein
LNPRCLSDSRRWVTAVVTRYGPSIDGYQIWNEANLAAFWQGRPTQMARLTLEAKQIIRRLDPTAEVVAASSKVRLRSAFDRFFPAYLNALRRVDWPVDVFAIHTYGPSTATPALRATYVALTRRELRDAHDPILPLWVTEVNYGIKGPGATAFQTTHDWPANALVSCRNRHMRICRINRGGVLSLAAWTSSGDTGAFTVPYYATRMCDARNRCQTVVPGTQMRIGRMPRWFG